MGKKLRIFYSGDGSDYSQPEIMLPDTANLMLTFWGQHKNLKPNRRLRTIINARKKKKHDDSK